MPLHALVKAGMGVEGGGRGALKVGFFVYSDFDNYEPIKLYSPRSHRCPFMN